MSISTYAELQTAVKNWIDNENLGDDRIREFITLGEALIYRDLRLRTMESSVTENPIGGRIAVPDDYVEAKNFIYGDGQGNTIPLEKVDIDKLLRRYPDRTTTANPFVYARFRTIFEFGPKPPDTLNFQLIYYKRLPALSDTNTTNWFTENAPDLLLFASLVQAQGYIGDDQRVPLWKQLYSEAARSVNREETQEDIRGGQRRARAM